MVKLRSVLIKVFSLMLTVCAVFAFTTLFNAKTVEAADEASFKIVGTSVYKYDNTEESKVGLKFEAEFNKAWLDKYPAEKYNFGMLIAPTANFTAFDKQVSATANMKAIDGVNFIRIQNAALTDGQTFHASILFDDYSLKVTIAEKLKVDVAAVTSEQVKNLKGYIFEQSYSVVAYMSYRDASKQFHYEYINRYDTSMRETAAKTYALGVEEGNEKNKALALTYLGVTKDDVKNESAYVIKGVRKLVVDSVENFEIKEEDIIVSNGKVLKLDSDYTIENGVVTFVAEKSTRTQEQIYIFRDGDINIVDVLYANKELSSANELFDFFMNKSSSENDEVKYSSSVMVLANDIDLEGKLFSNFTEASFSGMFDGRGHVLSNVTVDTKDEANSKNSTYGLFGSIVAGGIVKNVAFNDIKAIDHHANGGVLGYSFLGLMENVYLSYSVDNQSTAGMFVLAEKGTMRNMVIMDNYYDPTYDADAYIANHVSSWGVSPIVRSFTATHATYENVQVISRRPINYTATGSDMLDVVYTIPIEDDPETDDDESQPATVSSWGARTVYAENETKLWVDFDYFYRPVDDFYTPGLGLDRETATVQDTVGSGKTILVNGLRRYDDMDAFLADEANAENRAKLVATGFWKVVDGDIVWANDASLSAPCLYVNEVEYDASTGILYTTAWNGETINKITINGVTLTAEENGGLIVDAQDKIIGIRAKVNANDQIVGIEYRDNKNGTSNVIECKGTIRVYTDNQVYAIRNINYYTQLIFDATDLREAVGYNVDYAAVDLGTADVETDREKAINGKGYFVATTKDGSKYYEAVYNSGIYKMVADVDMEKAGIGYTNNTLYSGSRIGGFVGRFDGNGYTIKNFKPDAQGVFGRVGTYLSGAVLAGTNVTAGARYVNCKPVIKNLALTDVITSYYDTTDLKGSPILANLIGTNAYGASPNTTTVENIYVTVSSESTALGSLVTHLGGHTKMNNVYIVNPNEHNMIEVGSSVMYKMTDDPNRPTVENGTKVWNVMKNWKETADGVLFGWAYSSLHGTPGNDDIATGTLDNTTNTYVVSTMPINFSSKSSMFIYPGHKSYLPFVYSADNGIQFDRGNEFYKLGKVCNNANSVYVAIAYASNEEEGRILIPYGFKQSMIDEMKAFVGSGETVPTYGPNYVYTCRVCGEIAIGGTTVNTAVDKGTCKYCGKGTYTTVENASYKVGGNGRYATPCIYTFTVHTAADMGAKYEHTNGAFKLKHVKKYDNVEAMTNAGNDYSSFTGEKGNGMWKVVETKDSEGKVLTSELIWVGRAA